MVGLAARVAADDPGGSTDESSPSSSVTSNKTSTRRAAEASDPAGEGTTAGHDGSSDTAGDGVDDRGGQLAVKGGGSGGAHASDVAKVATGVALLASGAAEAAVDAKGGAVDREVTHSTTSGWGLQERRRGQQRGRDDNGFLLVLTRIRSTAWTRRCEGWGKRSTRDQRPCSCSCERRETRE